MNCLIGHITFLLNTEITLMSNLSWYLIGNLYATDSVLTIMIYNDISDG